MMRKAVVKIYTAQIAPWSTSSDGEVVLTKEGFNWAGFLLGPFWALWHGMWKTMIAISLILITIPITCDALYLTNYVVIISQFQVMLFVGIWANDFRRAALSQRGYVDYVVIAGRNKNEAEHRYLLNTVLVES